MERQRFGFEVAALVALGCFVAIVGLATAAVAIIAVIDEAE